MIPRLTWRDLEWLRSVCPLPLVVKGVLTAEDALVALGHGAEGVVVSNHGGRQLDAVPASLDALPEVAEAVGAAPRSSRTAAFGGIGCAAEPQ